MANTEKSTNSTVPAMLFARIFMNVTYPIVSAYEFDFLKEETIHRERWDASTIYLIVQHPLTYFDNVVLDDKYIRLKVVGARDVFGREWRSW